MKSLVDDGFVLGEMEHHGIKAGSGILISLVTITPSWWSIAPALLGAGR